MGSYFSRSEDRVQNLNDSTSQNVFPPVSGSYFAPYYYMGNEKFQTTQPESYLFGDNVDLQYLGPKAQNFSYKMPASNQLVQALKCLVNIRKDSLRLLRARTEVSKDDVIPTTNNPEALDNQQNPHIYNLEFTFDADCPCFVRVFYNAQEKIIDNKLVYKSEHSSEWFKFSAGSNQQFCSTSHLIDPKFFDNIYTNRNTAGKWSFDCIPIAIQISVENAEENSGIDGHCQVAYAAFEKVQDDGWSIKLLKQKQMINGVCYILQEIYGIENKTNPKEDGNTSDGNDPYSDEDDNTECVVCLSESKDTIILPCKHLSLCYVCANQIRYQQSGCPICRQSFRALLQIRAVQKCEDSYELDQSSVKISTDNISINEDYNGEDDSDISLPPLPPGYKGVSLIEAINTPLRSTDLPTTTNKSIKVKTNRKQSLGSKKSSIVSVNIEDETLRNSVSENSDISIRSSNRRKNKKNKKIVENIELAEVEVDQTQASAIPIESKTDEIVPDKGSEISEVPSKAEEPEISCTKDEESDLTSETNIDDFSETNLDEEPTS